MYAIVCDKYNTISIRKNKKSKKRYSVIEKKY